MSSCPNTRSSKPWPAFPIVGQASSRWRRWAAAAVLTLPALASAAPLLTASSGRFQSGGCLVGQTETAVSGPLSHSQHCSQALFGLRTADAFATADFGSLGARTFLTFDPVAGFTVGQTGLARANFAGEYVFTGPGRSVDVSLNLDLDGRLAVSGVFASASVQISLLRPGGFNVALVSLDETRFTVNNSLDADADFSALAGAGGGSVDIDTDGFTVAVGVPVHLELGLQAASTMGSNGSGDFLSSLSEFGSTLTFNRDGPAFTLPAGFTVNGPGVVDNQWIGADAGGGSVPEPGTLLLAGIALATVPRRRAARAVNPWAPALVCALALPMLASATPLLTTSIGHPVGNSSCLDLVTQTAAQGPLVDQQSCSDNLLGPKSATAIASADFGSLGASMALTMSPARFNTPSITGFSQARLEGEYTFTGPGTSVPVQLNLDLDGLLAVFGERSSAFVELTLGMAQFNRRARLEIRDNGLVLTDTSLDADIDFSSLLGLAGGEVEIDSDVFSVPVGVPVRMRLSLTAAGALGSAGSGGFMFSTSDFDSTLTFNRDGPVFTLPAGFTVNGPGVVDNQWIGADVPGGTVPEPGTLLLAGLGLCVGLGLRATAARPAPPANSFHAA